MSFFPRPASGQMTLPGILQNKQNTFPFSSDNCLWKYLYNLFYYFGYIPYTVKKFDEVVRHLHLVTQDQFTLVLEKVFGIPEDNFTINIELFYRLLKMSNFFDRAGKFQKQHYRGANLCPSGL